MLRGDSRGRLLRVRASLHSPLIRGRVHHLPVGTFRAILSNLRHAASNAVRGDPTGFSRAAGVPFEPMLTNGLTVRCHTEWPTDAALLDGWRALIAGARDATVFHRS